MLRYNAFVCLIIRNLNEDMALQERVSKLLPVMIIRTLKSLLMEAKLSIPLTNYLQQTNK